MAKLLSSVVFSIALATLVGPAPLHAQVPEASGPNRLVAGTSTAEPVSAAEPERERPPLRFGIDWQVLVEADHTDVRDDSSFNPGNRIANLASGQVLTEIRPDVTAEYGRLSFLISPRLTVGRRTSTDSSSRPPQFHELYVNRWRVKAQLAASVTAAYGRDVLQWGNGVFRSPSNPFYADNGRLNPIRELDGQEFATVTYNPNLSYAISFVSNTGGGRRPGGAAPFHPTNAVKFDYVGRVVNVTVIVSKQSSASSRVGAAYTFTASEALLLYGEVAATRGTRALYPMQSQTGEWQLVPSSADSDRLFTTTLVGGSYTLRNGIVLTTEYIHNDEGYDREQSAALTALGRSASATIQQGGAAAGEAGQLLGRGLDTGLRLERRNYLFGQVLKTEYRRRADLSLSYAQNLDGGGGALSAYLTLSLHTRAQLFAVANRHTGPADTEFGRLMRYAVSSGVRVFF